MNSVQARIRSRNCPNNDRLRDQRCVGPCFDLAEDTNATLRDGEMNDCNSAGTPWRIVNFPGSTSGALNIENVDIEDALVNLIDVDFEDVD